LSKDAWLHAEKPTPSAAERAGIQFTDEEEMGGFGLRMAKKKKKR
jgi:hypothetical protein